MTAAPPEVVPEVSPAVLRAFIASLVKQARKKEHRSGVIGVRARVHGAVDGHAGLRDEDGAPITVERCVSALAVREALRRRDPAGWLVVLTERSDADLGNGLLARLVYGRLMLPDLWDVVREQFQARQLDRSLALRGTAVAEALIALAPPEGWPPARGGVLTADAAMEALTARVMGQPVDRLDALGLLEWTLDPSSGERLGQLADGARAPLLAWLGERVGPAGARTLDVVQAGNGADAIPLALATGLLAAKETPSVEGEEHLPLVAAEARGRLAARLGGTGPPGGAAARAWGDAARALVERRLTAGLPARHLLDRAEALLTEAGAEAVARSSKVLPAGFAERLRAFAGQVSAALGPGETVAPAGMLHAERAFERLAEHVLAEERVGSLGRARMALRLLRWLATPEREPETVAAAVAAHVADGGWVDRARADVYLGDVGGDPVVAAAYERLYRAVSARRSRRDARFAALLAQHTEADAAPGEGLWQVEDVLRRVVLDLAAKRRVLLVVVDGMSAGVATELAESIAADRRWVECVRPGGRRGVLAALPTVTEVCRASLLSGALRTGGQAVERAGLAKLATARGIGEPALFHKADLARSTAAHALPPAVRAAVSDQGPALVAVVLNTVDDALDAGPVDRASWRLDDIEHLDPLLHAADDAGRVLVLTSDHGHVVRRHDSDHRPHPGATAARWRPAGRGTAPGPGETAFKGKRVMLGGGHVILPWQETLRYLPARAGYHGGASLAEAVVPLLVFTAGAIPDGWQAATPEAPDWWLGTILPGSVTGAAAAGTGAPGAEPGAPAAVPAATPAAVPKAPARPASPPPDRTGQDRLFAEPAAEPAPEPAAKAPAAGAPAAASAGGGMDGIDELVASVLASETYQAQRRRARRLSIDDRQVGLVLTALRANRGRLAQAPLAIVAGLPEFRLPGLVSNLQRLLNLDGYEVISYDADGVTVVLDESLLCEQFQVGDGA